MLRKGRPSSDENDHDEATLPARLPTRPVKSGAPTINPPVSSTLPCSENAVRRMTGVSSLSPSLSVLISPDIPSEPTDDQFRAPVRATPTQPAPCNRTTLMEVQATKNFKAPRSKKPSGDDISCDTTTGAIAVPGMKDSLVHSDDKKTMKAANVLQIDDPNTLQLLVAAEVVPDDDDDVAARLANRLQQTIAEEVEARFAKHGNTHGNSDAAGIAKYNQSPRSNDQDNSHVCILQRRTVIFLLLFLALAIVAAVIGVLLPSNDDDEPTPVATGSPALRATPAPTLPSTPSPTMQPTSSPTVQVTFWEFSSVEIPNDCLEVYRGVTAIGTPIIQGRCNGSSEQRFFLDSNSYIRSAADMARCLVGINRSTESGTNLILDDCPADDSSVDDSSFIFNFTEEDNTFRPQRDVNLCVGATADETHPEGWWLIELSTCSGSTRQQWSRNVPRAQRDLLAENEKEEKNYR